MILPVKIEIQIIDESGQPNRLANIVFGLKVFSNDEAWYTFSAFKTNADGHIVLTKQQIIDNAGLKHTTSVVSDTPTRFELYVWDGDLTAGLIKSTKRLLELYNDKEFIENDLLKHGVAKHDIPSAVKVTIEKGKEDAALFEQIKDAINDRVHVYTPKIEEVWLDSSPKQYKFIIV